MPVFSFSFDWDLIPVHFTQRMLLNEKLRNEKREKNYFSCELTKKKKKKSQKTSIKINLETDEGKQPKWNLTLSKRWNWSSCTKFTLSASWTHGVIAQLVRASEGNSVVLNSLSATTKQLLRTNSICCVKNQVPFSQSEHRDRLDPFPPPVCSFAL